jgi:peroxiredoxin
MSVQTIGGGGRLSRPRARLTNLAIMAVTAAAIVVVAFLANQPSPAASGSVTPVSISGGASGAAPIVGQAAPDFRARADDGRSVQLSTLAGSPVWLSFGASWCQPCRAENPDIEAVWEQYRDRGLRLVQVYMSEDQTAVSQYAQTVGLTYTRIPDPDTRLASIYRIVGIPSHFFIDRAGVLRELKIGSLDPKAMTQLLEEIMG